MWQTMVLVLAAAAQDSATDRATLIIRERDREVGRETYVLRPSRLPDGQNGYVLEARSQRRNLTASATVQLLSDGSPLSFTFTRQHAGEESITIRGTAGRGRFRIVRTSSGGDALREYPVRNGLAFADDALFALYTIFARQVATNGVPARVLDLELEECCSLAVERRGLEMTELRDAPARLEHLVIRFQAEEHHVWLTEAGRLAKVEIPSRQLIAERQGS